MVEKKSTFEQPGYWNSGCVERKYNKMSRFMRLFCFNIYLQGVINICAQQGTCSKQNVNNLEEEGVG